jgi:hypothetical protein
MNTEANFSPIYEKSNKRLLCKPKFISLDHRKPTIFLQKGMGMDPAENEIWTHFDGVEKQVNNSIEEKQALLCWQNKDSYSTFFYCLVVASIYL